MATGTTAWAQAGAEATCLRAAVRAVFRDLPHQTPEQRTGLLNRDLSLTVMHGRFGMSA